MPTPLIPSEKAAFIALVRVAPYPGGDIEANNLENILNNYEDIITAIRRQLDLFAENNGYLTQCMSVFSVDAELVNVGIYFNKTSLNPLVNPVILINSTYTGGATIDMSSPPSSPPTVQEVFIMLGNSYLDRVTLDEEMQLTYVYIGPGSTLDVLDSSTATSPPSSPPTYALVNYIYLPYLRSTSSKLNRVVPGSNIGTVLKDDGSYYGGILDYDPDISCSPPVSALNLAATDITHNSVFLSFTQPTNFLFIKIYSRLTDGDPWVLVKENTGYYVGNTGYVFTNLKTDTYYNFKVSVTCLNGGVTSEEVSAKTLCCGSGNTPANTRTCTIYAYIKDTPDTSIGQTLCNGVMIQKEYPAGTTLTIPYLINKGQPAADVIVDNVPYQQFPYNPLTGTFDATGTSLESFVEPNVVTLVFNLPL